VQDAHLCYASIRELGQLLKKRELSAVELVSLFLERIADLDPSLHAYITVCSSEALDAARCCDQERVGHDCGLLHGIPVALKDLFDTKGIRTTAGSRILADRIPEEDATTVARLRAAGAIIIGKCNMHEFAYGATTDNPYYGTARNPWAFGHIPGGSSGGSAIAVAAGLCAAATGNDTGGSIRMPAALCGVVGLKPTLGRVSGRGLVGSGGELDSPGPMARSVYDVALMLEAMAGWDPRDPISVRRPVPEYSKHLGGDIRGVQIALDPAYAFSGLSSDVHSAFTGALDTLKGLGAEVVEVKLPLVEDAMSAALTILMAETSALHAENLLTRPQEYGLDVRDRLQRGFAVTGMDYARAQRTRRVMARDLEMLFDSVDLLVTPSTAISAPAIGQEQFVVDGQEMPTVVALTRFTRLFNLTGLPAISVPCGFSSQQLPIGLQLVGAPFDEVRVLQVAHAYEQATIWHLQRPPLA
jgi:aspartyl-tRNA(Asn)/glutamyl-tRNA(Gln) amidotransferase subunit A